MKLELKKWASSGVAQWVIAIVAVFAFFVKLDEIYSIFSKIKLFVLAIVVGTIILVVILVLRKKISPKTLKKSAGFTGMVLLKTAAAMIVTLAASFFYSDNLSVVFGKVLDSEGAVIAREVEKCVLEGGREDHEKVMITLVDSETVRNKVYTDALKQAKTKKGYIDFICGRYHASFNWIEVPFTLSEDKIGSEKKLLLTLTVTEDERRIAGGGEKVLLLLAELKLHLPDNQIRQILKEIDSEKSILLTEDERKAVEECFYKHKEKEDLYSLMYLVLSDPNVITKLERKEAYDVEYYELRKFGKGGRIEEDEKIVELSDSPVVIKKTSRHLSPYDKIGIIGCYIDRLRFQHQVKEPASKVGVL